MSDPEDSHMLDSSSESEDEAMFPSEVDGASSSTLHDNNLAPVVKNQPSGLSPPQSQNVFEDAMDTTEGNPKMNGADQLMEAAQGIDQSNGNDWEPKSEFAKSAELVVEPGSSWNNKKAREEYQKAWNQIEDKGFTLKDFGDPFDESEERQENEK